MLLKKFNCSCGAPLEYSSGIIECQYCGSHYILDNYNEYKVEEKKIIERNENDYGSSLYFIENDYFCSGSIFGDSAPSLWDDYPVINTESSSDYIKLSQDSFEPVYLPDDRNIIEKTWDSIVEFQIAFGEFFVNILNKIVK